MIISWIFSLSAKTTGAGLGGIFSLFVSPAIAICFFITNYNLKSVNYVPLPYGMFVSHVFLQTCENQNRTSKNMKEIFELITRILLKR